MEALEALDGLLALLKAMELTRERGETATDAFSSNQHGCLTVVSCVDERAFAIAEAVNPLVPVTASVDTRAR